MKFKININLILFFILYFSSINAEGKSDTRSHNEAFADSIMNEVILFTQNSSISVKELIGQIYIKGNSHIEKKNFLLKFFPSLFPFDRSENGCVFEVLNNLHYYNPSHFTITPIAFNSTSKRALKNQSDIVPLLNVNISNGSIFDNLFIMPGTIESKGIYKYHLDTIIEGSLEKWYKIHYYPKRKSLKLIEGYLYISDKYPVVRMIEAFGRLDIARFELQTRFSEKENEWMIPTENYIKMKYNVANNICISEYRCSYKIIHFELQEEEEKSNKLNLTKYYNIANSKVPVITDSAFWDSQRRYSLTSNEKEMYKKNTEDKKRKEEAKKNDTLPSTDYIKFTEKLVRTYSYETEDTKTKYSGLLNPAGIGYSKVNGISIRQKLSFVKFFPNERFIEVKPLIGYNFKKKEIFGQFNIGAMYRPKRLGRIDLNLKTGNQGFSSAFIDKVNQALDSTKYDFNSLNIKYYRDYHIQLENRIELTNGLLFYGGISYNYRKPTRSNDSIFHHSPLISSEYVDFMPYIRLSWTPEQYYRYIRHQKQYIFSKYPTFSLEYAKSIPGIIGSTSDFDKVELDIHQTINLKRLSLFSYRIGAGGFFNPKTEYFVNYRYFWRSNYPPSWNDHIGGVFNLLEDMWYYASPTYVQAHFMYESPFLMLNLFKRISKYVLSERIYLSQLYTPAKPSYTEVGYGLGNYIFNVGVFAGFHKGKYQEIGFKFTFELDKYW